MNTLVVYDSVYGNTEKIALSINAALGAESRAVKAVTAGPSDLEGITLLVAGAPTNGGRPTPGMKAFLDKLRRDSLKGISIAAFDTRATQKWVKIFGYAAGKIEKTLMSAGGTPAVKPEGFFVTGTKGPLADGEVRRAGEWAKKILAAATKPR